MKFFFGFVLIVPLIYQNWIGAVAGIGLILAFMLGMFLRRVMTRALYEKVLTMVCIMSVTSAAYAICEQVINSLIDNQYSTSRISSVFFYPNYFGTIVGTVIIICAYKVLTNQGQRPLYFMIALVNAISMYLSESMFAWVEVFLGIAVLLIILKKHRLLAVWFLGAALASFLILGLNISILPRLSDVDVTTQIRFKIWDKAIKGIMKNPLIGHGLYSYMFDFHQYYQGSIIPHAHSIYLDALLNFGLIGTSALLWYFIHFYKSVIKVCFKDKNTMITSLILAVTAAALVHGIADVTLLWVQTLPLFLLILSGIGVYEKPVVRSYSIEKRNEKRIA